MREAGISKPRAVFRVTCGNFLEMYDFMVFGYYAKAIGEAFFPSGNEFVSLMSSLLTFGAGYLMRPVGAIVLGAYIDSVGRRRGLMLTLGLMSAGMLMIAAVPTYASIGILAPVLVVVGRLLQGFSAGVELGGVSVYLSEIATPGNKGFYVSWQSASQQVAVVVTALMAVALQSWLTPPQMASWGWRIPLLSGCLIVPFLFFIRRSLQETEEFSSRSHHPSISEIFTSMVTQWRLVLGGAMLVTMTTVSFYLVTAYTATYGEHELHLSRTDSLTVSLCVGLSTFFWLPIMGALSDRVGRRPIMAVSTLLALCTAYLSMRWLVAAPSFSRLLVVDLWLAFLYASYNGAMVVFLTEIMPLEVRTTGFSLSYSLATGIFGGFTPALTTYLINATHNPAMPGAWLSFAALCGLVATLMLTSSPNERPMLSAG